MRMTGEHLFVYGTLLVPQIMQQVSGQRHFSLSATLHDYARYGLLGKTYPGIVQQQGAGVAGRLYLNVSPAAWRRLDYYEDHLYQRQYVQVETATAGVFHAWTYVVPDSLRSRLTKRDWSLSQFRQRHLQGFLQHVTSRRHS